MHENKSINNEMEDTIRKSNLDYPKIIRKVHLADNIVIIDGQPGCGKSMLASIVSSLGRVELVTYAYEIEYIASLYYLKKIDIDAAVAMVRMLTDLQLYNTMMSRETNFRLSDVSSAFRNGRSMRYLKRLFQKGDEAIPARIQKENPILHLNTHMMLAFAEPIFSALEDRLVFIEIVRHPLYMIKQKALNMQNLLSNVRDFTIYFKHKDGQLPFFALGWEELFLRSNQVEKAIYFMEKISQLTEETKEKLINNHRTKVLTIPFELFVIDPWPFMKKIEESLKTKVTRLTRRIMKKQKVPRKMYAEGIQLKVYKRCGWQPPESNSENHEFEIRRRFAQEKVSQEAMKALDKLCTDYEVKYLGGSKKIGEHYE